jgi:outer membrane protein assembly factor BamB
VAAFHKLTGKMVWGAGREWGPSYASPVPATVHGKRRVFVFAGGESQPPTGGLMSIDAANGALNFSFPWRSKSYESVNAASPVVVGNQVFISASYRTGGALIDVLPDGKHKVAWTSNEIGTHWNTAVHKDGYLYAFDGRNEPDASLVCVELKTGKVMWRVTPEWDESFTVAGTPRKERLSTFRGTLLAVDGKFLALGELGHLLWLDLSPKGYKELNRTWLFAARETWSAPVLSRGLLYISQHSRDFLRGTTPRLLCYDLRGK